MFIPVGGLDVEDFQFTLLVFVVGLFFGIRSKARPP